MLQTMYVAPRMGLAVPNSNRSNNREYSLTLLMCVLHQGFKYKYGGLIEIAPLSTERFA